MAAQHPGLVAEKKSVRSRKGGAHQHTYWVHPDGTVVPQGHQRPLHFTKEQHQHATLLTSAWKRDRATNGAHQLVGAVHQSMNSPAEALERDAQRVAKHTGEREDYESAIHHMNLGRQHDHVVQQMAVRAQHAHAHDADAEGMVTLYRGVHSDQAAALRAAGGAEHRVACDGVTSLTSNIHVAQQFSEHGGERGAVLAIRVPLSAIVTSHRDPVTGRHLNHTEQEVVVATHGAVHARVVGPTEMRTLRAQHQPLAELQREVAATNTPRGAVRPALYRAPEGRELPHEPLG